MASATIVTPNLSGSASALGSGTLEYRIALQRKIKNAGEGAEGEESEQEVSVQTLLWTEYKIPEKKSLEDINKTGLW